MKRLSQLAMFVMLCCLPVLRANAACHVVTSTGSGALTGADWSNAFNDLPATLVRGDIYYLADGTYPDYLFTTVDSGTTTIEIRKAQTYDHCTETGWNAGTMGSGQAIFGEINISSGTSLGYVTFTGNGQWAGISCGASPYAGQSAKDCGIKVTGCGTNCIGIDPDGGATQTHNITIRYVELEGGGLGSNNPEQNIFRCRGTCNNILVEHVWSYEAGCTHLKVTNTTAFTVNLSYFRKNYDVASGCHGQMFISEGVTTMTWSNNIIQDIDGTGIWVAVSGADITNWTLYNNIVWRSPSNPSSNGLSNGLIDCINSGSVCSGILFYGNTIALVNEGNTTGFNFENSGNSITLRNNLWYSSDGCNGFGGGSTSVTQSNNSALNMASNCLSAGSNNVKVTSGSANPFTSSTTGDFTLTGHNANWNNGFDLGSPYNADIIGTSRPSTTDWDRGAYQVGGPPTSSLSLSPDPRDFGSVDVMDTSLNFTVTLTNNGGADATLDSPTPVTLTGTNAVDFAIVPGGTTCVASFVVTASGGSCVVSLNFTPGADGARSAILNVASDDSGSPEQSSLTGTGTTPGAISFISSVTGSGAGTATSVSSSSQNHTAGNGLVALVAASSALGNVTGISNTAGDSFFQCGRASNGGHFGTIWYAVNTNGSASDVTTATLDGSYAFRSIHVLEYSNLDTVSPCETFTSGSCTTCTTATSSSFSPASSGNVNVTLTSVNNVVSVWTPGTNYTQRTTLSSPDHATQVRLSAPSGAQTASQTIDSAADILLSVASFRPFMEGSSTVTGTTGGTIKLGGTAVIR